MNENANPRIVLRDKRETLLQQHGVNPYTLCCANKKLGRMSAGVQPLTGQLYAENKCSWLPRGLSGEEPAGQHRRHGFDPWVGKVPWRREWLPSPVVLPGESHGQRNLVGYSPRGRKESDTTERLINNKCSYISIQGTFEILRTIRS